MGRTLYQLIVALPEKVPDLIHSSLVFLFYFLQPSLPVSSTNGYAVPYPESLFTTTTATCVNGLVTLPTVTTWSVFGLGRYGIAVARELVFNGVEVIAVDSDEKIINAVAAELPICKCADITDPEVIRQLGISNVDVAIIAMPKKPRQRHLPWLLGCSIAEKSPFCSG